MTRAYNENYLNDAMQNLGEAFDYAVNRCKIKGNDFIGLFIASGFAESFGKGNPKIVAGLSGTELVMEIIKKTGKQIKFPAAQIEYERSREFWCGWILSYYQWKTSRSFKDIYIYISFDDIIKLYPTLHEASEEKFVDVVEAIIKQNKQKSGATKLQAQRKLSGYTQSKLAEKSGVNLRTLQQYESGAKDLGKASVLSVAALANALGCRMEDIVDTSGDVK